MQHDFNLGAHQVDARLFHVDNLWDEKTNDLNATQLHAIDCRPLAYLLFKSNILGPCTWYLGLYDLLATCGFRDSLKLLLAGSKQAFKMFPGIMSLPSNIQHAAGHSLNVTHSWFTYRHCFAPIWNLRPADICSELPGEIQEEAWGKSNMIIKLYNWGRKCILFWLIERQNMGVSTGTDDALSLFQNNVVVTCLSKLRHPETL